MTGASSDTSAEQHVETSPNGRYIRYNSVLGKGAYKTVYKAFDTEEALEVAWNKLHVDRLSEHDLEKVSNEVSLLRQVEHKNIIHFYDTWRGVDGNNSQTINFITEQMMSGTLKAYLRKAKAIKLKVIRRWCANILDAIAYLHSQSPPIMHRDLKCDNIFINGHVGEVKIGDLGLSGVKEREKADSVIGTPEFMAPELYEESYTEKVDIYAFGMCLLEIVSMEYPYSECNNMAQIFKKVFNGEKPRSFGMLVDGDVKEVICACLQREARRPSAVELLQHPLFRDWEKDEGVASNLSLVKGVHDTATVALEATPSSNGMPIGTEVIDWSDPLQRSVLVTMIEGDNGDGDEQQQFSVVASKENGGFYIGLEIPIRDAIKRVEFTFDPFEDNSTHIAQDMVAEFQLGAEQLHVIREEIDKRVRLAKLQRAEASRNATPQAPSRQNEAESRSHADQTASHAPSPALSPPSSSPNQTAGQQTPYTLEQVEEAHVSQASQSSQAVPENTASHATTAPSVPVEHLPSMATTTSAHAQPSIPVAPHPTDGVASHGAPLPVHSGPLASAHTDTAAGQTIPAVPARGTPAPPPHPAPPSQAHSTPLPMHPQSTGSVRNEPGPMTHTELAAAMPGIIPDMAQSAALSSHTSQTAVQTQAPSQAHTSQSIPVHAALPQPAQNPAPLPNGIHQTQPRPGSGSFTGVQTHLDVKPALLHTQHQPLSPADLPTGQTGLPHTSSFASSHTHSVTPVDTPSGVLSPQNDQVINAALSMSHLRHSGGIAPGINVAIKPSLVTGNEIHNVGRQDSQYRDTRADVGGEVCETNPHQVPPDAKSSVQEAMKPDLGHSSTRDMDSRHASYKVAATQTRSQDTLFEREEHDPVDFRAFPHSASDGQLPPTSSVTVIDIPPRPPSTPIIPGAGLELSDEHHVVSPREKPGPVQGREDDSAHRQQPLAQPVDSQGFRNQPGPDATPGKVARGSSGARSSSGSVPAIVVVGAPSQSISRETSRRSVGDLAAQSLPSFPSSEGFASSRYTAPTNIGSAQIPSGRAIGSHGESSLSYGSSQSAEIRGSASNSPQRSPAPKLPSNRISSWKSTQSDDSGNNMVPRVPTGKVIGEEHDQKYYTMCLTLMDHCARGRYDDVVRKLDEGANANFADYDQRTPLHLAAAEGHLRICALLIEHGARVDRKDRWANTPLADAAENGHEDVQSLLKSHGAMDERRSSGDNVNMELMQVAAHGDLEAVRSKIVAGADVTYADYDRRTPLHLACTEGHPEVAELLLVNGASPEAIDRKSRSPVDDAVKNGHRSILRVLRQYGANIPRHLFEAQPELENQKGMDLIEHAARGRVDAVRKALEQGANPNFADYDRRTALHLACVEGRAEVVRLLLESGAVVDIKDRWGSTPPDEAKKCGFSSIADELLQWERSRNSRQPSIVSFEQASIVVNGHDRSSLPLHEQNSAHLDQLKHGIASSVSLGAIPTINLSADDFAAKYPSSEVLALPVEKATAISLPPTPFDKSEDFTESNCLDNEERLLQQAYDAQKQKLEESHRIAMEGLQRKKSADSKSTRSSGEGLTPVQISVVKPSTGDSNDDVGFAAGNGRNFDNAAEATASGSFSSFPNGAELPRGLGDGKGHSLGHIPLAPVGSSSTSPVQVLRPPRYQAREVSRNGETMPSSINPEIRSLVDNLIDLASTRR